MKLYLAGRYTRREELLEESKKYIKAGHEITARWLEGAENGLTYPAIALLDLEDVDKADGVVLYTEPYGTLVPGGGRHVEWGYALGAGKKIFLVGPRENVFHWHPDVVDFIKSDSLIRYLNG